MTVWANRPTRHLNLLSRQEDGAAAVEFALISLILFTVVFGIIQYGLWLSEYEVFNGAAREGARVAALRGDATAVDNAVTQAASPYTVTGPIAISPGACTDTTPPGTLVTVSW